MSGEIRGLFSGILVGLLLFAVAAPALGARSGRSTERATRADEDESAAPEEDVRERTVGRGFAVEAELETDRSIETWMYVFSALMLLCVGWLCFKPTRIAGKKSRKTALPKKANSGKTKGGGRGKNAKR